MGRLLLFLPVCLFLQDQRPNIVGNLGPNEPVPLVRQKHGPASFSHQELLASLAGNPCQSFPANVPWVGIQQISMGKTIRPAQELLACLAATTHQPFPGNLPWSALDRFGFRRDQAIENLIRDQPTVFLQMCLERYDREVRAYSCTLNKWERVKGKLKDPENVEAHFREQPFSVFMSWKKGAGRAQRVLFVRGENNDKMLARPAGLLAAIGIITLSPDSAEVKESGRYLITEFGLKLGTERTLKAMLEAKEQGVLFVRYEGIFRVPETGDRLCYKLVRSPYTPPEDEGVNELTIYIDTESWLQVGSTLKASDGRLIAEYYFRDLVINPQFRPNQFTRKAL